MPRQAKFPETKTSARLRLRVSPIRTEKMSLSIRFLLELGMISVGSVLVFLSENGQRICTVDACHCPLWTIEKPATQHSSILSRDKGLTDNFKKSLLVVSVVCRIPGFLSA